MLLAGVAAALSILDLASLQRNIDLMVAIAGKAVVAVLILVALIAAAQVGIEISVLVLLAAILFGTAGIVAALALGLVPLSGSIAAGRYVQGNGIRPGDEISVNGIRGTAEELGLASVTLKSEDGRIHHVPNRMLLEVVVSKISQGDGQQERQE